MKKIISILMIMALVFSISIVPSFAQTTENEYLCKDEYVECKASIDSDFEDDAIIIQISSSKSAEKPYLTPEDFDGLGVIEVRRLTSDGRDQHMFVLTLDKKDKQNVLDVIEQLQQIEWVSLACPNYIFYPPGEKEFREVLFGLIIEYEGSDMLTKDDISLVYNMHLTKEQRVIGYEIKGEIYPNDIQDLLLGDYRIVVSGARLPMIVADGVLYEIADAYELGIINELDLECMTYLTIGTYVSGDVDSDTELTILDATIIQKYQAQTISLNTLMCHVADFDTDGQVSVMDATGIQIKLAGLE